ncbi:hypothetical protein [Mesorhizobium sp.]|uniref:thermonuclease family protein n=1 Tax=Mesorhizobium sp. TaxID=1871066 RepID=UPI00338FB86A
MDAPESRQHCDDAKGFDYPCGRRAAQALDKFLAASRPLHCSFVDRDRYGRLVGNCIAPTAEAFRDGSLIRVARQHHLTSGLRQPRRIA